MLSLASIVTAESCRHLTTLQQGLSLPLFSRRANDGTQRPSHLTIAWRKSGLHLPDIAQHVHRVDDQGDSFILQTLKLRHREHQAASPRASGSMSGTRKGGGGQVPGAHSVGRRRVAGGASGKPETQIPHCKVAIVVTLNSMGY